MADIGERAHALWAKVQEYLEKATAVHKTVFIWVLIIVHVQFLLGMWLNKETLEGWNSFIAFYMIAAAAFLATKPEVVAVTFIVFATRGLPDIKIGEILSRGVSALPNFQGPEIVAKGVEGLISGVKVLAHILFFFGLVHLVLEWVPFHGNTLLAVQLIVGLELAGFWAGLFSKEVVWYKRITLWIILLAIGLTLIKVAANAVGGNTGEKSGKSSLETLGVTTSSIRSGARDAIEYGKSIVTDTWTVHSQVQCEVGWKNNSGGFCSTGHLPPGTYKIVPTFHSWQQGFNGTQSLPMNPNGRTHEDLWGNGTDLTIKIRNQSPVPQANFGEIVLGVGKGVYLRARTDKVNLPNGGEIRYGPNSPQIPNYHNTSTGTITVEVHKLVE